MICMAVSVSLYDIGVPKRMHDSALLEPFLEVIITNCSNFPKFQNYLESTFVPIRFTISNTKRLAHSSMKIKPIFKAKSLMSAVLRLEHFLNLLKFRKPSKFFISDQVLLSVWPSNSDEF